MRPRKARLTPARRVAALCVGLALAAGCSAPPAGEPARTAPLQAVGPRGDVDWPITFSWSGAAPDAVVRIRIFDEAERPVFGIEARGSSKEAPQELKPMLSPGAPYQWRVARVDANGDEVDASEMTAFSLR